jgi:hypothetical protein
MRLSPWMYPNPDISPAKVPSSQSQKLKSDLAKTLSLPWRTLRLCATIFFSVIGFISRKGAKTQSLEVI